MDIKKKISEFLEEKNSLLNNEYVQLLGDTSKIINLVRGTSELILQKKFESFLKGFSNVEKPTGIQLEKLKNTLIMRLKLNLWQIHFLKFCCLIPVNRV